MIWFPALDHPNWKCWICCLTSTGRHSSKSTPFFQSVHLQNPYNEFNNSANALNPRREVCKCIFDVKCGGRLQIRCTVTENYNYYGNLRHYQRLKNSETFYCKRLYSECIVRKLLYFEWYCNFKSTEYSPSSTVPDFRRATNLLTTVGCMVLFFGGH